MSDRYKIVHTVKFIDPCRIGDHKVVIFFEDIVCDLNRAVYYKRHQKRVTFLHSGKYLPTLGGKFGCITNYVDVAIGKLYQAIRAILLAQ